MLRKDDTMYEQAIHHLYRELMKQNATPLEKRYRLDHSLRVANIAREVATAEGQDVLVATLGGILHDLGKHVAGPDEMHGWISADMAMPFVKSLGVSEKQMRDIHYSIAGHEDGNAGYEYEDIAEADTVHQADAIERLCIYRVFETLDRGEIGCIDASEILQKCEAGMITNMKAMLTTDTARRIFAQVLSGRVALYSSLN